MPKYGFLVVEGPHDVEFTYRLLSPFGFERVRMFDDVDPALRPLIPREYPPGGDLQKRMGTPLFLKAADHAIAVHSANGDSRLVGTIQENSLVLNPALLTGMGMLIDADRQKTATAVARYAAIVTKMGEIGFPLPGPAGAVSLTVPHVGAFVLPDNVNSGTLEDLLLECAAHEYAGLLASATTHVDYVATDSTLISEDKEDFRKPSGRNKALISAITSILRPGKAVQVSIQDNRWLRGAGLRLPRVKAVQDFLRALFEI